MKGKQNREIITTQVLNLSTFLSREHNLTNVQNCHLRHVEYGCET